MELFDFKIELRKGIKNRVVYFLASLGEFNQLFLQISKPKASETIL